MDKDARVSLTDLHKISEFSKLSHQKIILALQKTDIFSFNNLLRLMLVLWPLEYEGQDVTVLGCVWGTIDFGEKEAFAHAHTHTQIIDRSGFLRF